MDLKNLVVGIDLGTSNSAIAFSRTDGGGITVVPIEQLASLGKVHSKKTLPSALYLAPKEELGKNYNHLSWTKGEQENYIVGTFARQRGMHMAERFVSSAKSWLCHGGVSRKDPVLPWNSTIADKVSPFQAVARYLSHLRLAFEGQISQELGDQQVDWELIEVTMTVPASFDEVARKLSYEAARLAGFRKITLLEEPQAAFYSWIASDEAAWRKQVSAGDIVLVCDVGGGTTDFSLICVTEGDKGALGLERICVGDHLLLGGDNMDHALAHFVKQKLAKQKITIAKFQFLSLVEQLRDAKEKLLSDHSLEKISFSLVSRGSSLMAKAIKVELTRKELEAIMFAGFFPMTKLHDLPKKQHQVGLQEFGLNYELEPAISKHLASFLQMAKKNIASSQQLQALVGKDKNKNVHCILPSAVLFNGGVFKSLELKERVQALLTTWSEGQEVRELKGIDLDLAVAKGAVYSGLSKKNGKGIRIRSGTSRSYYLGLETAAIAVPGLEPEVKGLCIVPQGTEEGVKLPKTPRQFGLVTGEPVQFPFYSSSVRAGDQVGTMIESAPDTLEKTASLQVTLPNVTGKEREIVPVELDALVTDVGTLELSMKHVQSAKKWQLEFNVRASENE